MQSHDNHRARLRVLALSSIFPNTEAPLAAPYIRQQTAALSRLCDVEVWALLPWFPGRSAARRWAYWKQDFARVPAKEVIDGLTVHHPRCLQLPKLGNWLSATTYAASLLPRAAHLKRSFDVIFATWAYPDATAAVLLASCLGLPAVVQVIGSDINTLGLRAGPKLQLGWALPRAAAVVAVSAPLAARSVELGARQEAVHVIPTGLDRELFQPRDRRLARETLAEPRDARLILFVGRLFASKGIFELFDAFEALLAEDARYRLVCVGEGAARAACEERARRHPGRVKFTGELEPKAVAQWLAACDVLALPSHQEGTPNVVLEALGSGRRVVASRVGGIPALVRDPRQGELVPPHDNAALQAALRRVATVAYDPIEVARSVELWGWDDNAGRISSVLANAARVGKASFGAGAPAPLTQRAS